MKLDKKYINPKTGRKYEYYSRKGEGYDDVLDWAKHAEDRKNKVVKQQTTWLGYWVSTVWLGLDHSYSEDAPPLIFETMVFRGSYSGLDMDRYTTEKQAKDGHIKMVKKWSNPAYVCYKLFMDKTWSIRYRLRKLI